MNVSTYQSVSGQGKAGIEALFEQTAQRLNGQAEESGQAPIAFNVRPAIDAHENGYTGEEMKMFSETQKFTTPR